MTKIAIVLFNLGGPDTPEAVEPFLFNLFNDLFDDEGLEASFRRELGTHRFFDPVLFFGR